MQPQPDRRGSVSESSVRRHFSRSQRRGMPPPDPPGSGLPEPHVRDHEEPIAGLAMDRGTLKSPLQNSSNVASRFDLLFLHRPLVHDVRGQRREP